MYPSFEECAHDQSGVVDVEGRYIIWRGNHSSVPIIGLQEALHVGATKQVCQYLNGFVSIIGPLGGVDGVSKDLGRVGTVEVVSQNLGSDTTGILRQYGQAWGV